MLIKITRLIKKAFRLVFGKPICQKRIEFSDSKSYWEKRYKSGGNSGSGSYSNLAEFKAEFLNTFVEKHNINRVIEFGCGDGNQLKLFKFDKYIGLDVSETSIELCKRIFKLDLSKSFLHIDSFAGEKADLVLSLDVIYHLIEDQAFEKYMFNLFETSNRYVIIYSSNSLEVDGAEVVKHVKHRKFTDWVELNKKEFKLNDFVPNKFPFQVGDKNTSFADFYVFEKANF